MLSVEEKQAIYRLIPTSYTVKGQTLNVPVRYANQWEPDLWPCIILEYTPTTMNVYTPDNKRRVVTNEKIDEITFVTGTTIYSLSMTLVKEIVIVKGKLSGVTNTFVQDTDYQLTGDTIEWLGVDVPDNGTDFTVTFKSKWVRTIKGGEKADLLLINVYTKDYGKKSDSTFINGVRLADEIVGDLHHFFEFRVDNPEGIVLITNPDILNLDNLTEGEYQRRRQFSVEIRHLESYETVVESVEDVETTIEVEIT